MWWIWASVGLLLLIIEIMILGDFYIFFLGLGAFCTAVFATFYPQLLTAQFVIFGVVSVFLIILLRKKIINFLLTSTKELPKEFIDEIINIDSNINFNEDGTALYKNVIWKITNQDLQQRSLQPGDRAKIIAQEGIKLIVSKID